MYILKNVNQTIATSDQPIVYYEDQLAWLVIGQAWYSDPNKSFTVEQQVVSTTGSPNVIG